MSELWKGHGGNREVPPNEILSLRAHLRGAGAEAILEEEGGTRGKHGFSRESELEASEGAHSCGFSGVPGLPSGKSSLNLRATLSGTSSSTFPPKLAISFTPLEETKLTCGLAIT